VAKDIHNNSNNSHTNRISQWDTTIKEEEAINKEGAEEDREEEEADISKEEDTCKIPNSSILNNLTSHNNIINRVIQDSICSNSNQG